MGIVQGPSADERYKHQGVERVIATRLEDNSRVSMGLAHPGMIVGSSVGLFMAVRRFILRYLSFPRPGFLAVRLLNDSPDSWTGRYIATQWLDNPWYIKPTLLSRWGPKALAVRFFGTGNLPSKNGQFRDEGYDIRTIGPGSMENKGQAEVDAMFADLKKRNMTATCPFNG
ncbi:hypothetical protein FE257_006139 [Aspergillus nanangensis]|uniref:Uncharacterized protein n=1 Tax=Aspergillus nanangensis TaxID=2582783 RepID=A0AAD4CPT1_ASPNN|nr:hypothetical protein FE257_006139 [Aspergillus nanangensis]